jgi:hypothetical protein
MKSLYEALKSVRRLDDDAPTQHDSKGSSDELDFDLEGEPTNDAPTDEEPHEGEPAEGEPTEGDEDDFDLDGKDDGESDAEQPDGDVPGLDNVATQASDDPDRKGLIRTVKDSHLVYKRESEDGTFEELWVFNVTELKAEMKIRKAILAGTDIPINNTSSPDGKQEYSLWTAGNMEMLKVTGLPS